MSCLIEEPGGGDVFTNPPKPPRLVVSLEAGKTRLKTEIKPNSPLAKYFAAQSQSTSPGLSTMLTEIIARCADSDRSDSGVSVTAPEASSTFPPHPIQYENWRQHPYSSYSHNRTRSRPQFLARRWGAPNEDYKDDDISSTSAFVSDEEEEEEEEENASSPPPLPDSSLSPSPPPFRRYGIVAVPGDSDLLQWIDVDNDYDQFSRDSAGALRSRSLSRSRRLSQGSASQLDMIKEEEEEKAANENHMMVSQSYHVDERKGKEESNVGLVSKSASCIGNEINRSQRRESDGSTPSLLESEGPLETEGEEEEKDGRAMTEAEPTQLSSNTNESLLKLRSRAEEFEKQRTDIEREIEESKRQFEEEKLAHRQKAEELEANILADRESLQKRIDEMRSEDEHLRRSFEKEKSLWEEKMLDLDTAEYNSIATTLEEEKNELSKLSVALEGKQQDVTSLTDSVRQREDSCTRLRERLTLLEQTVDSDEAHYKERRLSTAAEIDRQKTLLVQRLKLPLNNARKERSRLRKRYKATVADNGEKARQLESLRPDYEELASENARLEGQIRSLQSQLKLTLVELHRSEQKNPRLFKVSERVTSKGIIRQPLPQTNRLAATGLVYDLTKEVT